MGVKYIRNVLYLILFLPLSLRSETLTLLNIPLNDGSFYTYQIDQEKKCSFENVQTISIPQLIKAGQKKSLYDKIQYLQQKINLDIAESEITNERITFALTGAENISFEFFYKPATLTEECKLVRVLHYNEQQFNMKEIKIDYNTSLKSPVVERILIKTEESANKDLYIYPWALRGQMSLYELNVGPALNIHTNIRVNDQNKFNKNNPVVEPIPGFFFRYGPIFINKNGMGSLLYNSGEFSILGMGLLEGEPYEGKNLRERNTHIFAGSIIKYSALELTYYRDFFKNSGYNLKLNIAPEFYYRISWKFSPQFFIQYWDNRYVDEYFGISKQEALDSGLSYYLGTHTINYGTMFEVMHFSGKWTYVMDVGLKVYGKEVYDSPTVSRSREIRFITSVLYKFF